VVDLLEQHCQEGRRFEPTEFVEAGTRVAVGLKVRDPNRRRETAAAVFKVFGFEGEHAVLLQDCNGRDDALAYLAAT
jgi:hypothetical protein